LEGKHTFTIEVKISAKKKSANDIACLKSKRKMSDQMKA